VNGNNLTVSHATGTGFISSTPVGDLHIAEDAADGTTVGFAVPTDVNLVSSNYTFDLTDPSGNFEINSTTGKITVAATNTLDFETNTSHDITVAVTDAEGQVYNEVMTIIVDDANDAPMLATIEAQPAIYVENGAPLGITGNLALADVDDTNIESASVAISSNFAAAEDELVFVDQAGISGSYDATTGILTLTGSATVAEYQTALRTVAYNNTSDNPSALTRTVSFEINDGDLSSNLLSRDINFNAVNDAPTLSGTEANPASYTENDAPLVITGSTVVNDLDDTNIESASVVISNNFANGEDVLGFTSQSGITGTYDSTTGVLSLIGAATLADYQSALNSITYANIFYRQ